MPEGSQSGDITVLLQEFQKGDSSAGDRLIPLVLHELHDLACIYMRREGAGHTLQPTALVNEAYLRLVSDQARDWQSRSHFIGVAASVMRRLLIDHARRKHAAKRQELPMPDDVAGFQMSFEQAEELVTLNVSLERLEALNARHARIVELRYFGGLSIEETAEALKISPMTVKRDWRAARAWLKHQVRPGIPES